jgi:hypothetical protein
MQKPTFKRAAYATTFVALGFISLTGCVDHDYDLSKDIDLNVTIAGDSISLPTSSTAELTMDDLLDLSENSSIKKAEQGEYGLDEGDYVLVEEPNSTKSNVKVNKVVINKSGLTGSATTVEINFPLALTGGVVQPTNDVKTTINLKDDNVDQQLLTASEANCDVKINVHVTYTSSDYNGAAKIKAGTRATFPSNWTLAVLDSKTQELIKTVDNNQIQFKKDVEFHGGSDSGKGFNLIIDVVKLKLGNEQGAGLYKPGHFDLNADIVFNGEMEINNQTSNPGQFANVKLSTTTEVTSATLNSITGTVNPSINVDPTSVTISNIPDFLSNQDNTLGLKNPQIYLTVNNSSPVKASISAKLTAIYPASSNKSAKTIEIGDAYDKTRITINGDSITKICLSQTGTATTNDSTNGYPTITVEGLSDLLTTIPERIEISDIKVVPDTQKEVTIMLDHTYEFETAYKAVVPFQFTKDMKLHYTTETDRWQTDFSGYNFKEIHVSMDVDNQTPFGLTPNIIAIGKDGNEMSTLTCTFQEGHTSVAPNGTSTIVGIIKSTGTSLDGLTSIKIDLTAHSDGDKTLNANQTVQLTNINVSVHGGVTVDLDKI